MLGTHIHQMRFQKIRGLLCNDLLAISATGLNRGAQWGDDHTELMHSELQSAPFRRDSSKHIFFLLEMDALHPCISISACKAANVS